TWHGTAASYKVSVFQSNCTTPLAPPVGPFTGIPNTNPTTTFNVTGLPTGASLCLAVQREYPGGNLSSAAATASTGAAPTIYQTINGNRPEGTLGTSQRGSGLPFNTRLPDFNGTNPAVGDFDPPTPDYGPPIDGSILTPATRCAVTLH